MKDGIGSVAAVLKPTQRLGAGEDQYPLWWKKATGEPLSKMVLAEQDYAEMQKKFRALGLRVPPMAWLVKYKNMLLNTKEMALEVNAELLAFLRDRIGVERLTTLNVLDAIITCGFNQLHATQGQVGVTQLLKALELKMRLQEGSGGEAEVQKRVRKLLGDIGTDNEPAQTPVVSGTGVHSEPGGGADTQFDGADSDSAGTE